MVADIAGVLVAALKTAVYALLANRDVVGVLAFGLFVKPKIALRTFSWVLLAVFFATED